MENKIIINKEYKNTLCFKYSKPTSAPPCILKVYLQMRKILMDTLTVEKQDKNHTKAHYKIDV